MKFTSNVSFKPDNKPTKKRPQTGTLQEVNRLKTTKPKMKVKFLDFPTSNKPPFAK